MMPQTRHLFFFFCDITPVHASYECQHAEMKYESGSMMNESTFAETVKRMTPDMYRVAVSMLWNNTEATDAMQEAILRAWEKRDKLREEDKLPAWLMRILVNECRTMLRRRKFQALPLDEAAGRASPTPPDIGLWEALKALPEKYRLPIVLHHVDGYDLQQVSAMLSLPVQTVRGRLFYARKKLRDLLQEDVET